MNLTNKATLEKANTFVAAGDYEGFLNYCTDDTEWNFIGDQILHGKEAVRQYMAQNYIEPPRFNVEASIAEGDFVTVTGHISLKGADGEMTDYHYCDIWRFREGKMAELKAFVIEMK